MTRLTFKLSHINRLKHYMLKHYMLKQDRPKHYMSKHYMLRHYMLRHYMLVFMLCVLMLAPACGRRGDLHLPPEKQSESNLPAPATPINTRH